MRQELTWLNDALANKDIVQEMTYYRVKDNEIRATNGRLTAGHPWPHDGAFLVPGVELEKVVARMPGEPNLKVADEHITVSHGRFRGRIDCLPVTDWDYPGVEEAKWGPFPEEVGTAFKRLRPFISDNATRAWAMSVCLNDGRAYATNNVSVAGTKVPAAKDLSVLVPLWAVDFVLGRLDGLTEWAVTKNYIGFRWSNGAWMRSQLIEGQFPEAAFNLVRDAAVADGFVEIEDGFKDAYGRVTALADGPITIHADKITATFKRASVEEEATAVVDTERGFAKFNKTYFDPVVACATHWDLTTYPEPSPFKGDGVFGKVVGMT